MLYPGGKTGAAARHLLTWFLGCALACCATIAIAQPPAYPQRTWIEPYPETVIASDQSPVAPTDGAPVMISDDATWMADPPVECCDDDVWNWRILPSGLAYRAYLAGPRESRLSSFWAHEKDQGWLWDVALGGRAALLRYGTQNGIRPQGWELQIEGGGLPRLGMEEESDVQAVDFRVGVPLVYAVDNHQFKLAYYHLSSHVGDEFLIKNPGFERLNYVRDAVVLGTGYYLTPELRAYGEAAYAFNVDGGAKPWEFQFGMERAPAIPTGYRGAPFAAVNAHLREEFRFSGNLVVQAGWAWRGDGAGHLLRTGFEYFNGRDDQYSFLYEHQQKVGLGLWYDF
jgi:hypothetical protein